jgi:ABC-type long-subunit fatty acid transport system fused permease/ATPase subunit
MSIVIAVVYFTLETLFTVKFGQSLTGYLPDLMAAALLLVGGTLTIKNPNAVGILCGAWGFSCCLHYRSWAWRFNDVMEGTSTELVETTMTVLMVTMPISFIAFGMTLIACLPKHRLR